MMPFSFQRLLVACLLVLVSSSGCALTPSFSESSFSKSLLNFLPQKVVAAKQNDVSIASQSDLKDSPDSQEANFTETADSPSPISERIATAYWVKNRHWKAGSNSPALEFNAHFSTQDASSELQHAQYRWILREPQSQAASQEPSRQLIPRRIEIKKPTPKITQPSTQPPSPEKPTIRGQNDSGMTPLREMKSASFVRELESLAKRSDAIGWNALILLAHFDPEKALQWEGRLAKLSTTFLRPLSGQQKKDHQKNGRKKNSSRNQMRVSEEMQAAAIEAWCLVLKSQISLDDLPREREMRFAPVGRLLRDTDLPTIVHAELIRSLCFSIAPSQLPSLEEITELDSKTALPRSDKELRLALLDGCIVYASNQRRYQQLQNVNQKTFTPQPLEQLDYPKAILQMSWDSEMDVRSRFGKWVALVQHPDAIKHLKKQLFDTEVSVRLSAIENLGYIRTTSSLEQLRKQAKRPEELHRVAAAQGLAPWGFTEMARLAKDESFRVRVSVIQAMAGQESLETARYFSDSIIDRSPQVQQEVLSSVSQWNDQLALPILFQGIIDGNAKTRKRAALLVRHRKQIWIADVHAPRDQRRQQILTLAKENHIPLDFSKQLREQTLVSDSKNRKRRQEELSEWLRQLDTSHEGNLREHALENLKQIKRIELSLLEKELKKVSSKTQSEVVSKILPDLFPEFKALKKLTHSDLFERRLGARRLVETGQQITLSTIVRQELPRILAKEQDRFVWRDVLRAISQDATEESMQIATLALKHRWSDIQKLGCEYVKKHPQPRFTVYLMPLLQQGQDKQLKRLAVEAIGLCNNPIAIKNHDDGAGDDTGNHSSLHDLLRSPDRSLAMAAAISLSRLGDPQGMAELTRMSYSLDSKIRRDVIRAMADSKNQRFIRTLIRIGWTEKNDRVKREILSSLARLVPQHQQPVTLKNKNNIDDSIQQWVNWWQEQEAARKTATR